MSDVFAQIYVPVPETHSSIGVLGCSCVCFCVASVIFASPVFPLVVLLFETVCPSEFFYEDVKCSTDGE